MRSGQPPRTFQKDRLHPSALVEWKASSVAVNATSLHLRAVVNAVMATAMASIRCVGLRSHVAAYKRGPSSSAARVLYRPGPVDIRARCGGEGPRYSTVPHPDSCEQEGVLAKRIPDLLQPSWCASGQTVGLPSPWVLAHVGACSVFVLNPHCHG